MTDDDLWADLDDRERRRPSRARVRPPAEPNRGQRAAALAASPTAPAEPARGGRRWPVAIACLLVGALLGGGGAAVAAKRSDDSAATTSTTVAPTVTTAAGSAEGGSTDSTAAPVTAPTTTAPPTTVDAPAATSAAAAPAGTVADDLARAKALAPLTMPSDCGLPFGVAESLPNGARDYRGGVHEGIDFICGERGRNAVAALDGQIVMANSSYVDPTNDEREEILATAKELHRTPFWTLAMLFGRFVVIDHGIRPNVGHVVTIYAHLEEIDPAIKPGVHVKAGQRLGEIGNRGTETAATNGTRPQSIHLHWEIHIDEHFLGQGASVSQTDQIYRALFGR
jgi:murein DD-endopeptidase MepM/ murein hydrolase activator NlpD